MRLALSLGTGLALTLASTAALAQVHEPNGLSVPIDSSPEIQLYTLFSQRGENINWQTDAHTSPASFSPLCGFTATYVLNQAGSHFGLAWYNDTGTPPQPSQLYQLVAPNSPVGTTFNGTVIKNDPNYLGGLVGFALVGGETHYTNSAYDTVCTSCSPAAPWITALMYASTVQGNAYYVCFEDGPTSSTGWNNDGDFNDDVYFVTGITCQGGGVPCMTGKPGICGPGITDCTASGTTCHELNPPAPHETCNGIDDNCDGQVDEGNPCPASFVCVQGTCVHACSGTEFECTPPTICATNGYCEDPQCVNVTCPSGKVCVQGLCKAPCDGVTCPYPQTCRVGKCVDPCAGVTCQAGQVCNGGACINSCNCAPCGGGEVCDKPSGLCVTTACSGVTCSAGKHCVGGSCVDDCSGAACPDGAKCSSGQCQPLPDAGAPDSGGGLSGPGSDGGGDDGGGSGSGGSSSGGANGASDFGNGRKAGCGCRITGLDTGNDVLAWIGAAVALTTLAGRSRRRRR
jgi:hypothetical protein